MSIHSFRLFL